MEERNANGIPNVAVTFPDGHNDVLILDKFYANEEDRMIHYSRYHSFKPFQNDLIKSLKQVGFSFEMLGCINTSRTSRNT